MTTYRTCYVGPHRWDITHPSDAGNFKWHCTCGKQGSIATSEDFHGWQFTMEAFARHAHDALTDSAVELLGTRQTDTLDRTEWLVEDIFYLREAGEFDKANLLQRVVNNRYQEAENRWLEQKERQP